MGQPKSTMEALVREKFSRCRAIRRRRQPCCRGRSRAEAATNARLRCEAGASVAEAAPEAAPVGAHLLNRCCRAPPLKLQRSRYQRRRPGGNRVLAPKQHPRRRRAVDDRSLAAGGRSTSAVRSTTATASAITAVRRRRTTRCAGEALRVRHAASSRHRRGRRNNEFRKPREGAPADGAVAPHWAQGDLRWRTVATEARTETRHERPRFEGKAAIATRKGVANRPTGSSAVRRSQQRAATRKRRR